MPREAENVAPSLPRLSQVIARHGLTARKSLGQNFLLDPRLAAKIAAAAGPLEGRTVVEIGAGPGGLTRALLMAGAREVIAIEKDARCIAALSELRAAFPDRLTVIEGDALKIAIASLAPEPVTIVANLPYNLATALLIKWLGELAAIERFTLMFQREVALRLCARPGTRDYGRLTVLVQWLCDAKRLFDVPPGAFVPAPRVTSSLVALVPRKAPRAPAERVALEAVLAAAFGQRRKMLRSALKSLVPDAESLCAQAGVAPTARAEELSVEAFCALARAYRARQQAKR
ncbi:MAG TPA: 16S rRNA (adenine(1518)-N(6)/adenine(1519)-N(6))-dimethyltransferase RsmA [Alphaproteobacteria bacterium]|nr:16S rRNA (adenine(1518)-N(6)/adenine(1519)-N(6))-dimethyltransferase RsmA [Alphaproteobacteria bacterium]